VQTVSHTAVGVVSIFLIRHIKMHIQVGIGVLRTVKVLSILKFRCKRLGISTFHNGFFIPFIVYFFFFYDLSILFLINSSEVYPPFLSLTYKMEMFEANREFVLAQCSKFMKETQTEFKKVINNSSRWSRYLLYIFP
jgi:hypothetical protein